MSSPTSGFQSTVDVVPFDLLWDEEDLVSPLLLCITASYNECVKQFQLQLEALHWNALSSYTFTAKYKFETLQSISCSAPGSEF